MKFVVIALFLFLTSLTVMAGTSIDIPRVSEGGYTFVVRYTIKDAKKRSSVIKEFRNALITGDIIFNGGREKITNLDSEAENESVIGMVVQTGGCKTLILADKFLGLIDSFEILGPNQASLYIAWGGNSANAPPTIRWPKKPSCR